MLERPQAKSRKRRKARSSSSGRVLLYGRVSTAEQAEEGASLFAQRSSLEAWATAHGYTDRVWIEDRGVSGRTMERPGMQRALAMLTGGEAGIIAAVSLSRLSRSVIDAASLLELAADSGFRVVALDLSIDTGTSSGRLVANLMASVAEWERDVISERTRAGLAAKRAQGIRLGRPSTIPDQVRADIAAMREAGLTYAAISDRLNAGGVPTATGRGRWHTRSVYAAVHGWAPAQDETPSDETGTVRDETGVEWATHDANGPRLIYPGRNGEAYRDRRPVR